MDRFIVLFAKISLTDSSPAKFIMNRENRNSLIFVFAERWNLPLYSAQYDNNPSVKIVVHAVCVKALTQRQSDKKGKLLTKILLE